MKRLIEYIRWIKDVVVDLYVMTIHAFRKIFLEKIAGHGNVKLYYIYRLEGKADFILEEMPCVRLLSVIYHREGSKSFITTTRKAYHFFLQYFSYGEPSYIMLSKKEFSVLNMKRLT